MSAKESIQNVRDSILEDIKYHCCNTEYSFLPDAYIISNLATAVILWGLLEDWDQVGTKSGPSVPKDTK